MSQQEILRLEAVKKYFPVASPLFSKRKEFVHAVEPLDLTLYRGECLGIVGESGSGKSTLGRLAIRLIEPTEGQVFYSGKNISAMNARTLRRYRAKMQMIFQDPYSSLNPRMTIGDALAEAVKFHQVVPHADIAEYVAKLLSDVNLNPDYARRYPRALSGGQRQRVAIARALAVEP